MKKVLLSGIIVGIFLISTVSYGIASAQEESLSDIAKRLDQENLEKAQQIRESQTQEQLGFGQKDCPPGTIEKAISGGGIDCIPSGETVPFDDNTMYLIGGIVVAIIIIALVSRSAKGKPKEEEERRGWTRAEQQQVLDQQGGKCADCGQHASSFQFDHKDNNHSNNSMSNCQALCPNCHDRKTRGLN